MKLKLFSLLTAAVVLLSMNMAQAATTLMQIGRCPFHQPPLTSNAALIDMVQQKKVEIKKGFSLTPQADVYGAFMEQLPTADIQVVQFPKGSHFEWMFFKAKGKGKVRVSKDLTWGNEKPFPGFKFTIDKDGDRYTFVVPFGCGNVALMSVTAIPVVVAEPPPAPVANRAPQCSMKVTPVSAYCGEMIMVDARSSADSDGNISKMTITFINAQGQVVSEAAVPGNALVADVAMPCGHSTLKVSVVDNDGAEATSEACTTEVTGKRRVRFVADVGYLHQIDPANYLLGRIGLEHKFSEELALLGMIGVAPHFEGIDGETALLADLFFEYSFPRFFVDFGAGGWITDGDDDLDGEDSQLDLIGGVGTRIYGEPDEFNTSLFLEVRSGVDELNDIIDYGRFGGGLRCRF